MEDSRKGEERDLIGIVPVVTTAANALYVQSMLDVNLSNIHNYESLKQEKLQTLKTFIVMVGELVSLILGN